MFLCSGEDGEVFLKLLDFGIAKVEDPTGMGATRTGSVMGTPYYMSPEQVMGLKNVDFRTDLWSLGVVAFEALVGRKAFMGETLGALAVAITHAPMPVPSRFNASFPPALDDWFAKACARTATDRFGSAKEMASAFRAAWGQTPSASSSAVGMPRLSSTTPLLGVRAPDAPPAPMLTTTTSPMLAHADTVAPPMSSSTPIALGVLAVALLLLLLGGGVFFYAKKHAAVAPPDPTTAAASAIPTAPASATASPLLPLEVAPSSPPDPVVKPTHAGPPLGAHVETKHDAGAVKPTANATAAKPDCNPPYYYDSAGDRVFKKECVQ
jgi:serine/threonine-protein kinase